MIDASGAVFGVSVAFAMLWPEAEMLVFPSPSPHQGPDPGPGRGGDRGGGGPDPVHVRRGARGALGGMLAGWLFFKIQAFSRHRPVPAFREQPERAVMVQQTAASRESERPAAPIRPLTPRAGSDPVAIEVDRVLDKISATGIESLTAEERRFLDEVSKRKQKDLN
ncbi:MAG: hypothetical protein IPG75_22680 [Gemmatimonadetes bacterium]|nr:hypothetical protein [Gemmatimonadota bacterium]